MHFDRVVNPEKKRPTFSAAGRRNAWDKLARETFDLLVVGGGVTGAGIAQDAATRGLSVALLEAGDFARGTSSRSSRLIHGGLRYLESFEFGLVFESLSERRRLTELCPHLVRPLPFLFPVYSGAEVGMLKLAAGMWLYDALALFEHPHRLFGPNAAAKVEPRLRRTGLRGAARYYDAQVDDARLTLAVARAAHQVGATVVSYAAVEGFARDAAGAVTGVHIRDRLSGAGLEVNARLVVGAAGPWTDDLRRLLRPGATPRLRLTKGTHLQLRRDRVGNRGGITFKSPVDQRVMFVLPWGRFTYVGTTDTDFTGSPGSVEADRVDVDYLLTSLNAIFPDAHARSEDVISAWAGVRPLIAPSEEVGASQTSREHEIWREEEGPLFVAGGKLTTFRRMAAEAVDHAAEILRREHRLHRRPATSPLPIPGRPEGRWEPFKNHILRDAVRIGLSLDSGDHLASTYGQEATDILLLAAKEPDLREPILPGHPEILAEVVHTVNREMALTLEDVLRRRIHLFYDASDGASRAAESVARLMAPDLGWSDEETARQIAAYREIVARSREALIQL